MGIIRDKDDKYSSILEAFDSFELNDIYLRRAACIPLYDYFQNIVFDVGVEYCSVPSDTLIPCQLKTRWNIVARLLSHIQEPPEKWDNLVKEVANVRNCVAHNDDCDPGSTKLQDIRNQADDFYKWFFGVAEQYYVESSEFSLAFLFHRTSMDYITQAENMIEEYGKNTPFSANLGYSNGAYGDIYTSIHELKDALTDGLKELSKAKDLDKSHFEILIQLVETISLFRGREEALLRIYICPKCGSKIETTQEQFPKGQEPTVVHIRTGCSKCDFVYNEDFEDI